MVSTTQRQTQDHVASAPGTAPRALTQPCRPSHVSSRRKEGELPRPATGLLRAQGGPAQGGRTALVALQRGSLPEDTCKTVCFPKWKRTQRPRCTGSRASCRQHSWSSHGMPHGCAVPVPLGCTLELRLLIQRLEALTGGPGGSGSDEERSPGWAAAGRPTTCPQVLAPACELPGTLFFLKLLLSGAL